MCNISTIQGHQAPSPPLLPLASSEVSKTVSPPSLPPCIEFDADVNNNYKIHANQIGKSGSKNDFLDPIKDKLLNKPFNPLLSTLYISSSSSFIPPCNAELLLQKIEDRLETNASLKLIQQTIKYMKFLIICFLFQHFSDMIL